MIEKELLRQRDEALEAGRLLRMGTANEAAAPTLDHVDESRVNVSDDDDRRIYAVKKIILESERGRFAKACALQNRKLRREVTTISRMTHNNIVRYYQAWVEGGTETTEVDPIVEEENLQEEDDNEEGAKDNENGGSLRGRLL